jgi:hypothetical protein
MARWTATAVVEASSADRNSTKIGGAKESATRPAVIISGLILISVSETPPLL